MGNNKSLPEASEKKPYEEPRAEVVSFENIFTAFNEHLTNL